MMDLVIDVENAPGALAKVAGAISDAGVNMSAATFLGGGDGEVHEVHILVPHAEAAQHALATSHGISVTRIQEVAVTEVHDRPGELADLTRVIAEAGIDLELVYIATGNRVVFGAKDIERLKEVIHGR